MKAVSQHWEALRFASKELRNDRAIVLTAISHHLEPWEKGHALEYASAELRGDREVVMKAVSQHWSALEHASEELRLVGVSQKTFLKR